LDNSKVRSKQKLVQNKEIVFNPTSKSQEVLEISRWFNNLHKMPVLDFHNTK